MPSWLINSVRATAFFQAPVSRDPMELWRNVALAEPSGSMSDHKSGIKQASGEAAGGSLLLITANDRVDWILGPNPKPEEIPYTIGDERTVTAAFSQVVERWLPLTAPYTRIGYGPVYLKEVATREEGYEFLAGHLRLRDLKPNYEDFYYQVNKPRSARIGGSQVTVNRVGKWSVAGFRPISVYFEAGADGVITEPVASHDAMRHYVRIEFDINSRPEQGLTFGPAPASEAMGIFREFAAEMLQEGDIP